MVWCGAISVLYLFRLLYLWLWSSSFTILLKKTIFGRDIYMIGSNQTAATYSAIPVQRRLLSIYSICGMTAGLAGLILTARLNAAEVAMGDSFDYRQLLPLSSVAHPLLGGTGGPIEPS